MGDRLAAVAVAVPFLLGSVALPSPDDGEVVLRFRDPAIVESSGLVAGGGSFVTVNDSGDAGRVFVVDGSDGGTVGVTTWAADPVDVEALAPGGGGHVWVGDIGDNAGSRAWIQVARVPVGGGSRSVTPTVYRLRYPGGAEDAEALLRHPRTGRLYVVTKEVLGGGVYAAPRLLAPHLSNPLRRIGDAPPIVTDGAFFPDGRHLVLRDYGRAVVYSFPGLVPLADVGLPEQEQGEGIAVAPDGGVFVSSEGRAAPVFEVELPPELRRVVAGDADGSGPADPGESAGPTDSENPADATESTDPTESTASARANGSRSDGRPMWPWVAASAAALAAIGVLLGARRRR